MIARAASRPWADAAALTLLKLGATALVLRCGFRAVSDDDYARVVIAQRFAENPTLDPTGTSWLPLPFYVYGGALRLLGSSLDIARGVAVMLGVGSALVAFWAARLLGLGRWGALCGAAVAATFPYAAYLGAATVPEAPTAALSLLAAATLETSGFGLRLLGAGALFAATAARYEPWALSALFAGVTAFDAYKTRSPRLLVPAAVALAFPALWLLHGIFVHGDATFFVSRVAAYRAALGPETALLSRLLHTPRAFFLGEPELTLVVLCCALPALFFARPRTGPSLFRFSASLLAIFALSMAADLRSTAATHHAERALLTVWLGGALLLGAAIERLRYLPTRVRHTLLGATVLAGSLGLLLRFRYPREPFVERASAVAIGVSARAAGAHTLGIDSPDYAFFAVQAGFGRPNATRVLDDRDPRKTRPRDLLASDAQGLAEQLALAGIGWLALPQGRAPLARALGSVSAKNADWVLIKLSER